MCVFVYIIYSSVWVYGMDVMRGWWCVLAWCVCVWCVCAHVRSVRGLGEGVKHANMHIGVRGDSCVNNADCDQRKLDAPSHCHVYYVYMRLSALSHTV